MPGTEPETRRKDVLDPITPGRVGMYVCGPTVYDRAHIGNARPVVVFDVLFRLLRHVYGEDNVTYVRNITDVDDKINARAAESGRSIREITDETAGWFMDDTKALGALPPTHQPRATEYVPQMVTMIGTLIGRGHAYEAEGHVLFKVASYPEYGQLARRSLDEMRAGARVACVYGINVGPGGNVSLGCKTGTTTDNKDAWFVGYTPQLTAAVWMGYADADEPMIYTTINGRWVESVYGGLIAAPTWKAYMLEAAEDMPMVEFEDAPSTVVQGEFIRIPSIGGQTVEDATATLEDAGFNVTMGYAVDSGWPQGLAVATTPAVARPAGLRTVLTSARIGRSMPGRLPGSFSSSASWPSCATDIR